MIHISVYKQSNYPVSAGKIKRTLTAFFKKEGIVSEAEASVSLVNENKMKEIGQKYLKDKEIHNVLSFTSEETKDVFNFPPDGKIHLGEIIVCYPMALSQAKTEGKLIEEKVLELIEHGALHLMGVHHE